MGRGWVVLVFCAVAAADDEAAVRKLFDVPAALPGKFDYAGFQAILKARGYPPERTSEPMFRPYVAQHLGEVLRAPCTVRKVTIAADGVRGEAITDHGGRLQRWFLVRRDGRWRYGDFEHVHYGIRLSDAQHLPAALDRALDAYRADDLDETVRILRAGVAETVVTGKEGPATVRTVGLLLLGRALYERDDNADALAALAACEKLGTNPPGLLLLRARAAHDSGDYELALTAARAYVAAVGADPDGRFEAGRALLRLGRRDEAAAEHRAGLAAASGDGANVLGLLRSLPAKRRSEAVDAFLGLEPLGAWFDWIAWELNDAEDWDALEALVAAFRAREPDDRRVETYELHLLVGRGKHAEAAPRILAFLPRAGDARADWARTYLQAMHELAKPLQGYEALPEGDRDAAWSYLASLLAGTEDADGLAKLLDARGEPAAADAARAIWEIEILWLQEKHDAVDLRVQEDSRLIEESDEPYALRVFDRQVRSLLRLGRREAALARATARGDDVLLLLLVHAAMGNAAEAVRAFEAALADGYDLATLYDDPDAGPHLRGDAYAELRKKYPRGGR